MYTSYRQLCVQDFQCVEGINFGGLSIVNSTINTGIVYVMPSVV